MSINHQWLLGALSRMLRKINNKKSNQIMRSQEAKESQGKARRRRETNLKTGAQNPSPSPSISCTSPFTSPCRFFNPCL
jgi:hypothetical protein